MPNRSILVNFRLTTEEFESLKAAAYTCGKPNVSDYVRRVTLASVKSSLHVEAPPEVNALDLEANILEMQATIRNLGGLLDAVGAAFIREARKQVLARSAHHKNFLAADERG